MKWPIYALQRTGSAVAELGVVCASEAGATRVQVPPLELDCSRAHRGGRTVGRETQV